MNHNRSNDRDYPERPFLAASIAVYRDGRFLLTARANPPYEHIYSLPGGLVETGESIAEAARRELMEEVGIEAQEPVFVGPVEVIVEDAKGRTKHHLVIMVHTAFWKSGEPKTSPEAPALLWATPEETDALSATPRLKEMLLHAKAVLGIQPFKSGEGQQ